MNRPLSLVGLMVMAACAGVGFAELRAAMAADAPASPPVVPNGEAKAGEQKKDEKEKPDFPPFKEFAKDFVQVPGPADGAEPLYTLFKRDKDQSLYAELPKGFAGQKHYIAATLSTGDTWAGLQGNEVVVYWRRYDKTMVLVEPNFDTRSTGDAESQSGVAQQYTDRVLLEAPILGMGPGGQPVIDLKALLSGNASRFFAGQASGTNAKLATVKDAKNFPENIEVSIEMPAGGGVLRVYHWSISKLPESTGYTPRVADERIGYFTTSYKDLGKFRDDQKWTRYINRWHLEKRDSKLKLSPPKKPIVFYIDANVPVRYRRYVREGILSWNAAFEKVGIADAIEVYYQDKSTGANMDKDPEDVRYNFIRWLSNDVTTAVGPSRADPRNGQILDADIVVGDGWVRYYWNQANEMLPEAAMEGLSAETVAWLDRNPQWDPRYRLASPVERDQLLLKRAARGVHRFGGVAVGGEEVPAPIGRSSQASSLCMAARGKAMDMALGRMHLEIAAILDEPPAADSNDKKDQKKDEKTEDPDRIDDIPEWFVGPMLTDLVAHEVGHTLGLRHNFKASSIYSLDKVNSDEIKGKKPFAGSVMDYIPVNINRGAGPVQGDYTMIGIGPYDFWAIEYGYTTGELKDVLKRVAEPQLAYLTDEDTGGSDPLARRYDFGADPLEFATNTMRLVEYYRGRLTDKFVKDGESWAKARRGYQVTLSQQMRAVSFMAPWVGGAHVNRARKGDLNAQPPIEVVPVAKQRAALKFVVDNTLRDEAFGLSPELMKYFTVDKWYDRGGERDIWEDSAYPVHDQVMGVQSAALTMLINPTTLKRVYDNELRTPKDQDMLTLPELLNTVTGEVFKELQLGPSGGGSGTARSPMISSLKRNLQRETIERLIDLTTPGQVGGAAAMPISNLALAKLRDIRGKIKGLIDENGRGVAGVDEYSAAHLAEAGLRIDKVLDAVHIYNTDKIGGGMPTFFMFGQTPAPVGSPTPKHYGLEPGEPADR